ncbi:unnamed protein product [Mytilus edulis]|uniref:Uncharacterized protein n=1 Tax=Mytilus edulis TaxID=6550 RepID=A0A8S3SWB5_MYTED|nr:unnamed protein product [Mytilus edulis]
MRIYANECNTNIYQYLFVNKTYTEAQHRGTSKLSYSYKNSSKLNDLCDIVSSGISESLVSAKQIPSSSMKNATAEEEPNMRSKPSLESNIRKTLLPVQGSVLNECSTNFNHHFFFNKTNSEAQLRSTYKSSFSNCNSAKTDVRCDVDFSINSDSIVSDLDIIYSSKQRTTAKEKPTLKVNLVSTCSRKTRHVPKDLLNLFVSDKKI